MTRSEQADHAQRVVVLGSVNTDLVLDVDRLPVPGETVLGRAFRTAGGGKGANQAVAAARLGARVSLIACVGQDDYGRQLQAQLRQDDIDLQCVRLVDDPSGVAMVIVQTGGQNLIVVAAGANDRLAPSDVAAAQTLLAGADVLVGQLEVPLAAVAAGAAAARHAQVPFMLNAAPARTGLTELLTYVDVLIVNESELGSLVGQAIAVGDEATAARGLLERGPQAVVVTLGSRGASVVDTHGATSIPAFKVTAVDATAAGDAFVGALAARLHGLDSLVDAARYASAAAALACTRPGAQPSLPSAAEVERFLARS